MRQTIGYVTLLVRDYDEAIAYFNRWDLLQPRS